VPDATELVSTSELRAYIQAPTGYDTDLASIKASVEQWVKTYCRDPFLVVSRTEYHDGNGKSILRLRHYPLTAAPTVNIDADRAFAAATAVDSSDIIDTTENRSQGIVELLGLTFTEGQKNVKVVYSAGHSTIPADLKHAVLIICAREFLLQNKKLTGQVSQNLGDKTINLNLEEIPRNAWDILQRYQRPLI
jgi:hypothetical protein